MKSKLVVSFLILVFNFNFLIPFFSDDIKFQKIFDIEKEIFCISQDNDGLLWIGSEGDGLFCYNGNTFQKVKIDAENSLKTIYSIFADREGLIWFFMEGEGLCSFDKEKGIYKKRTAEQGNKNSLTNNSAHWLPCNIAEDKEGLIWVGTIDGLNSYDKQTGKFTQYRYNKNNSNSICNNSIWAVFVGKDGLIWIGTEDGLNSFNKKANSFSCYKHDTRNSNSISDNCIRAIAEDKEGNIWIGTKNTGIDKFDKKTGKFTNYRHNPNNKNSVSYNEIHHLMVDRYNSLWICNEGNNGVDRYDIKTTAFRHYSYNSKEPNTISSNNILCTLEDNSGIVWLIDSSFGSLNKCVRENNVFRNYSCDSADSSSISSTNIVRLYRDKMQNIWIGTFKGGLCLYTKDGNFKNFHHIPNDILSLPTSSVDSILDASNGKLWLGLEEGFISLFDINTEKVIKNFKNPYYATPCYLTQDNKNPDILWFGCFYKGGLFSLNTITGRFSQCKTSISNKNTINILQDGNILWIGTGGDGLCKFDKATEKCTHFKHNPNDKNSISGDIVIESFIDSKGNFWVATDDGGLNKFDKQAGKFTHYGTECGFPSNSTRHILEDKEECLWISTDSGIVKFDPKLLKVVKRFTEADGLTSSHFDKLANPLKDPNGNFWFSTLKGLCKFNPEEASKIEAHVPPIILSSFRSKEGTYNEDGTKKLTDVKLKYPDNSFEFTFSALDYMDPEKNQYAYKLEGFDKDWDYIGTNNFSQYSNLNPGEYTLHLKGSNSNGVWNEEGISIKITIAPPFWMTSWFRGLAGIVILSIIGGMFLLRKRALKKKAIYMRDHAVAEVAGQVAHDIRSPLAALSTALRDLKGLPEQKRILIRNATHRISDIANNLLTKYMLKENEEERHLKTELVSSLLEHLISEKRFQMLEQSIDLVLELGDNAHNCFVNLEPGKFKRVISNLINNASEAIESKGVVRVVLAKESDMLMIKIIDNGKGIPADILLKIKQDIVVSAKKDGQGIGVSSAVKSIKNWNGNYDIQSKVGEGTTFTITLPIVEEPDWVQSTITLSQNTNIVVVDDDESIHNIWQAHFSVCLANKSVTLDHFYESLALIEYCKTSRSERDLFLVDYELITSKETGLDLIEQLDLKQQAILVTSRYEEPEIRERIKTLGIKIIPKSFAPHIPIRLVKETVIMEQPELIFIDDNKNLTMTWEMRASSVNKKITTFNRSEDFKKGMNRYNKNIPIYIDSDLKEKVPGEMFAKFLYEQGFQTMYLATGYEKSRFGHMPWIKDIVPKEPPF